MKKRGYIIVFGIIILVFLGMLILPNINNENFWNVNIYHVESIFIVLVVSFFVGQRLTEFRRKVDFYEKKLVYLQEIFKNKTFLKHDKDTTKQELVLIGNILVHIREHAFKEIEGELAYIEKEFIEVRQLYDEHVDSLGGIEVVQKDIDRHLTNAYSKIDSALLKLYDI